MKSATKSSDIANLKKKHGIANTLIHEKENQSHQSQNNDAITYDQSDDEFASDGNVSTAETDLSTHSETENKDEMYDSDDDPDMVKQLYGKDWPLEQVTYCIYILLCIMYNAFIFGYVSKYFTFYF